MGHEHPYARYTRENTWSALYSQHINAGYILIPFSKTNNSIEVTRYPSAEIVQRTMALLNTHSAQCDAYYRHFGDKDYKYVDDDIDANETVTQILKNAKRAVVLARSSDYYKYALHDKEGMKDSEGKDAFSIVICGLHDSYLQIPVWEMKSNKRYDPRTPSVSIDAPDFVETRKTQFGHNILLGALYNGDKVATTFLANLKANHERTYWRIRSEVDRMQEQHFRGRPLAFMTEAERAEVGAKISAGLKRYHARRRLS